MPQTKYDNVKVSDKAEANALVAKGEVVQGVKFVNVGADFNGVVVTHDDTYDEAAFKEAIGIA